MGAALPVPGIERFHIALHTPGGDRSADAMLDALRAAELEPALRVGGPWHEDTNTRLREELRAQAGNGWHLLADVDEFQQYAEPLEEVISRAEADQRRTVGGLFLDRVGRDGGMPSWDPAIGLDATYPLGGHITHRLLQGDPRKITLARGGVAVTSGNHRAPDAKPDITRLAAVHHFKWRSGLPAALRQRVDRYESGAWQSLTPSAPVLHEARRCLAHLDDNGDHFDIKDSRPEWRRCTLARWNPDWATEAADITTGWKPPGITSPPV